MYRHVFTEEQDNFIRQNYKNVSECVRLFNAKFGTRLSYSSVKSHANRALGIGTGFRAWTKEMDADIADLLLKFPYQQATDIFNERYGVNFSRKKVETHCCKIGVKRGQAEFMKRIDEIIAENIDKTYPEIVEIIHERTGKQYKTYTQVCVRANNLGLNRPHRVWNNTTDRREINGTPVTNSQYVRFIGHRFHRLAPELQPIAMQVVMLQDAAGKVNQANR